MGLMRVLGFRRTTRRGKPLSDVTGNTGAGNRVTAEHYQPAGDDAYPLADDHAATVAVPGSGRVNVVAYADPKNEQKAQKGEKRIYARDANGDTVAWAWLKNTSEIEIANAIGVFTISPEGEIKSDNGEGSIKIAPDGNIEAANSTDTLTMSPDGTITVTNGAGNIEMAPGGAVTINGVVIGIDGSITSPTGLVAPSAVINDVEVADHDHTQPNDSAGNSEQPTDKMR